MSLRLSLTEVIGLIPREKIPPNGIFIEARNLWITGTGQVVGRIHDESLCAPGGCAIHNPTDPHQDWPTHIRVSTLVERICPHGVGHPDKDSAAYFASIGHPDMGVHGCCGCCGHE